MIQGITITLIAKTQTGVDAFNKAVYSDTLIPVANVLVGQPTTDDITTSLSLYGKKAVYVLGIPKEDANDWTDVEVVLPTPFEGRYRTFGFPVVGIPANVPLSWNKKVWVERYG